MNHIICFDPRNTSVPGTVVTDEMVPRLRARHVGTLPVDETKLDVGPVSGYSQRFYGRAGRTFASNRNERGCGLLISANAANGARRLSWLLRCEPIAAEQPYGGHFRLTFDQSQGMMGGGLSIVRKPENPAPPLDPYGGFYFEGENEVALSVDGTLALVFYGQAQNLRVITAAVTCR